MILIRQSLHQPVQSPHKNRAFDDDSKIYSNLFTDISSQNSNLKSTAIESSDETKGIGLTYLIRD